MYWTAAIHVDIRAVASTCKLVWTWIRLSCTPRLINDVTSFSPHLAMQCSHCHSLNRRHSFLLPKCAHRKLLVHLLMCLFGGIILYRWIGDTACCCGHGEVQAPAIARRRKCVSHICARRWQVVRGAPNVLFIIHYLRMRSSKNDRENWSGQNRTSQTACYGHGYIWSCKNRAEIHILNTHVPYI